VDCLPKVKIEVAVGDVLAKRMTEASQHAARTIRIAATARSSCSISNRLRASIPGRPDRTLSEQNQ
jgi:hypothetical protein